MNPDRKSYMIRDRNNRVIPVEVKSPKKPASWSDLAKLSVNLGQFGPKEVSSTDPEQK